MANANKVEAPKDAPKGNKVVSIKDAAVFKRLNDASAGLVSTYGLLTSITKDCLRGAITGKQLRDWEQSFSKGTDEEKARARNVIRQIQNKVRSLTSGRKASEGGKVTFILNDDGTAYTFSKVTHNRSGNKADAGKGKAEKMERPVTVEAAATWMLAYVTEKGRTPAEMAAARELVAPIARKLGLIQ